MSGKGEAPAGGAQPPAASPGELSQLAGAAAELDAEHVQLPPEGAQAVPDFKTHELLAMLLTPAFAILAPNWKVSAKETEQLAIAWGVVVDKYFPDIKTGPEVAALLLTVAVVTPRVMAGKPLKEPPPKAPADEPGKPPAN